MPIEIQRWSTELSITRFKGLVTFEMYGTFWSFSITKTGLDDMVGFTRIGYWRQYIHWNHNNRLFLPSSSDLPNLRTLSYTLAFWDYLQSFHISARHLTLEHRWSRNRVRWEVLVDVDGDSWVRWFVGTWQRNGSRALCSSSSCNIDLGTFHLYFVSFKSFH